MTKRVLISGTAGFIFSNFIRKAIYDKAPYEFFSVDKIAQSSMMNNIFQNEIHKFYIADICDEHIIDKIFEYVNPEIVINGAAEASVDRSINDPNIFMRSNIIGTQNLINLSIKYKTELYCQISTDEVGGSLKKGEAPWTEEVPLNPKNAYSASKAAAEMLVKAAHNTHGLNYIITRSVNNYGARQTPDKLIARTIKCILDNKPIPVYGNGEQIRDWIHTADNCSAILKILASGKINETYNISANQERRNIDVINTICEIMGKGKELITPVADRLGHDTRYALNSDKLRGLGWKPVYKTFEDGLPSVINWYISNPWFLKNT